MTRFFSALVLAGALVGCDAASPDDASIQYQVSAASDARTAEVSVDGGPARTVSLPFSAQSQGTAFAIQAAGAQAVDVSVRIDGVVRERGVGRVVRLSGSARADHVEVEGPIESIDADAVTVRGLTFRITADTEIEGDDREISLGDLLVGDRVEVEGRYDASGDLVARAIEMDDDGDRDDDDEVEVEGQIEDLDGDTITVAGLTFVVTADTEVDDMAFGDLRVGDRVEVEGYYDGDVLIADEIEGDDDDRDDDDDNDEDDDD